MPTVSRVTTYALDREQLREAYAARRPTFERASTNVCEAITLFLSMANIVPLAVTSRVKALTSFLEKVERKGYDRPFDQNTDFVGIRVLLFLPEDIPAVVSLLKREFEILEEDDKSTHLPHNQFGYRSHHLILRIPDGWSATPNYRGLRGLSIEVQVRTVLMHAWAEIEHKLQYKSEEEVPVALRRKLSLLSAKIEEADGQFQDLVVAARLYREKLAQEAALRGDFDASVDLTLDSFKAFVRFFYPGKPEHDKMAESHYGAVREANLSMPDVIAIAKEFSPLVPTLTEKVPKLTGPAYFGYALQVTREGFGYPEACSSDRVRTIKELREQIGRPG